MVPLRGIEMIKLPSTFIWKLRWPQVKLTERASVPLASGHLPLFASRYISIFPRHCGKDGRKISEWISRLQSRVHQGARWCGDIFANGFAQRVPGSGPAIIPNVRVQYSVDQYCLFGQLWRIRFFYSDITTDPLGILLGKLGTRRQRRFRVAEFCCTVS